MLKSLLFKKKKTVPKTTAQTTQDHAEDREEDGFVLLGETEIERSTVLPGTYPDQPPSYSNFTSGSVAWSPVMGQQPSNQKVVKQTGSLDSPRSSQSGLSVVHPAGSDVDNKPGTPNRKQPFREVSIQNNSATHIAPSGRQSSGAWEGSQATLGGQRTPVSDVPFRLGELLELQMQHGNNHFTSAGRIPRVDVHSYSYDFDLERSVVRDFNNSLK